MVFSFSGVFMNTSQSIIKLSQAMLKVQQQLQPAIKDARNAFVGNDYATLNSVMEACKDTLLTHGIWLTQLPTPAPVELGTGHIGLETKLIHAESGEWISSTTVIPLPKNDPQGIGSAITYARRYSLCAMLGIVTEDDDGNAACGHSQNTKSQRRPLESSQRQKELQRDSTTAKKFSDTSNDLQSRHCELPKIDGVSYRNVQTEEGRVCVVATGCTLEKKDLLRAAGFKWNPQQKIWWKYATTA